MKEIGSAIPYHKSIYWRFFFSFPKFLFLLLLSFMRVSGKRGERGVKTRERQRLTEPRDTLS